jgi:hypothetical protein
MRMPGQSSQEPCSLGARRSEGDSYRLSQQPRWRRARTGVVRQGTSGATNYRRKRTMHEHAVSLDRIHLIVGVTGHRDTLAADAPTLRSTFGSILREQAAAHPHTPLLVLTALAAGADLLAAEEAIAQGIAVVACLPMPPAAYELDFPEPERVRFRSALDACSRVVVTGSEHDRTHAYVSSGAYIAHYAHILVAFWDSGASAGVGGTADVVRMRETGLPATEVPDEASRFAPEIGPVINVLTPRSGASRPQTAWQIRRLYPRRFRADENSERDFQTSFKRLDRFNADLVRADSKIHRADALTALSLRTDWTANALQQRMIQLLLLLYGLAFIAASAQIVLSTSDTSHAWKLGTLLCAFIAYVAVRRSDYESRYQDCRALAEGLRVQAAWNDGGLGAETVEPHYLNMQQSELLWIRMALRSVYLLSQNDRPEASGSFEHPGCVSWIRGQWRYFYTAARREARSAAMLSLARRFFIATSIASGIATIALLLPGIRGGSLGLVAGTPVEHLKHWLAVSTALAAALAALLGSYAGKRNFSSNAKRYERMFIIFDRARRRLQHAARQGIGNRNEIIRDLGREALIEQADWLLTSRERPLAMVEGT